VDEAIQGTENEIEGMAAEQREGEGKIFTNEEMDKVLLFFLFITLQPRVE